MMNRQRSQFMKFDHRDPEGSSSSMENHQCGSIRVSLMNLLWRKMTVDNWRKAVLNVCVIALGVDPLFLFVPEIDAKRFCFTFHKTLAIVVSVIRSLIDIFYVIYFLHHFATDDHHLITEHVDFITEPLAPRSQESTVHSKVLKIIHHLFYIIDFVSILPMPQFAVFCQMQRHRSDWLVTRRIIKWIILAQYVPRIIRMYPLYKEVTRPSGRVAETKSIGAAFNLFLYILHSYVFGAFWYVSAIEKQNKCWRQVCAKTEECNLADLYCAHSDKNNSRFLYKSCPLINPEEITNATVFNFGMYMDALQSGIVEAEPKDFPRKFFYCFWWGLRNISALGQNLKTSNSVGDIIFAIIICVSGLLLFAVLIGNVQKYLQSNTISADNMEDKKRDREKWMSSRKLPKDLKVLIRKYEDYKWRETRGYEEDYFLSTLPIELGLQTRRYIYTKMLKRVPWLSSMDDGWLRELLCDRVKHKMYPEDQYIVREGESVKEMLIVTKGSLICKSTKVSYDIHVGDTCGDLLIWILDHPSSPLPTSNVTIWARTDVEGFILLPDDLIYIASRFNDLQRENFKHKFKCHSKHWRSRAACFIQETWRRFRKRSKTLRGERDNQQNSSRPRTWRNSLCIDICAQE